MKRLIQLFFIGSFLFVLPFVLFLGVFSTQGGDSTEFQPATPQEKVALDVSNFITGKGGTLEFASALIGNMEHESGLNPARIQSDLVFNPVLAYNPSIDGYALGLPQMDGARRVNMLNLAKKQKKEWQAVSLQLEYIWNHDGSDSELLKRMSKSKDVNTLAVDILKYWERAGTKDDPVEQIGRKTSANNWYKRLSTGSLGTGSANIGGGKIDVLEKVIGQTINGGQCYGGTAYYVEKLGGPALMGSGHMFASQIGEDYEWSKFGWTVIKNPKYSDVKAGDVINFGQGGVATSIYGHTGIVASVEGNGKYTNYEQNSEQGQIVAKYMRQWEKDFPITTSIVRKN
ncbi:CHAP domain-containing protein [Enterococcus faecalis]|uniref:phage tail tip lysozyme n=1 Tax=Enterococcus faecalis TaxID=1351 RepID=UPI0017843136|nr:phage tail tip lysozyme [Enterococcus faecalis]MBD9774484.1 CHAP domain-containing protein [Enterococcus faecalis]MBD9792556.1 CHAP domain-containing protein [Enterococcus faecalis]MBD9798161.1 CHAP domain-containing protein [Enterococcus faecalis]